MQMINYVVGTGIVTIPVEAASPREAIEVLKQRIHRRRFEHQNELIGMSLVESLDRRRLNFIVMDEGCTQILCGELDGQFQNTVSLRLAQSLRECIPDELYNSTFLN
jgi:hypothetical protein